MLKGSGFDEANDQPEASQFITCLGYGVIVEESTS